MSSNGSRPRLPRRGLHVRRPFALLIGLGAALLIAGVLVAPIVILGGGGKTSPCAQALLYRGRAYAARPVTGAVQSIATGVGVVSGCGAAPSNVDVRSLAGVPVDSAVAVAGDSSSVYVRTGVCGKASKQRLLACLQAT
jgi:hypothetical protein